MQKPVTIVRGRSYTCGASRLSALPMRIESWSAATVRYSL